MTIVNLNEQEMRANVHTAVRAMLQRHSRAGVTNRMLWSDNAVWWAARVYGTDTVMEWLMDVAQPGSYLPGPSTLWQTVDVEQSA